MDGGSDDDADVEGVGGLVPHDVSGVDVVVEDELFAGDGVSDGLGGVGGGGHEGREDQYEGGKDEARHGTPI